MRLLGMMLWLLSLGGCPAAHSDYPGKSCTVNADCYQGEVCTQNSDGTTSSCTVDEGDGGAP